VDIFIGIIIPDNTVYLFDSSLTNLIPAKADNPTTFTPARTSLKLTPGYNLPPTNFFSLELSRDLPAGTYTAFAAFTEPGSTQTGSLRLIGNISFAYFTITR
jgi:hypothetical protein